MNHKFCNIFVFAVHVSCDQSSSNLRRYLLWLVMSCTITCTLPHCILFHSVIWKPHRWICNVLSQIQELMLYEFKLGPKTMQTTQNICCAKSDGAFDHSNQIVQIEILLRVNLMSSIWRVSGNLSISQSHVLGHLYNLYKSILEQMKLSLTIPKYYKTFDLPFCIFSVIC